MSESVTLISYLKLRQILLPILFTMQIPLDQECRRNHHIPFSKFSIPPDRSTLEILLRPLEALSSTPPRFCSRVPSISYPSMPSTPSASTPPTSIPLMPARSPYPTQSSSPLTLILCVQARCQVCMAGTPGVRAGTRRWIVLVRD